MLLLIRADGFLLNMVFHDSLKYPVSFTEHACIKEQNINLFLADEKPTQIICLRDGEHGGLI